MQEGEKGGGDDECGGEVAEERGVLRGQGEVAKFAAEGEEQKKRGSAEECGEEAAGEDGVVGERAGEGEEPVVERELGVSHADPEVVEGAVGDELRPAEIGSFVGEDGHVAEMGEAEDEVAG